MKKALITIATMAAGAAFAAGIPQEWAVDVARVKPHQIQAFHGDSMELKATYWLNGAPFDVGGESFRLYWQTNAMEEIYWSADATAASNTVSATFANTMDPGAPIVYGFLGSTGGNYRASFAIRFSPGPGAVPNALPLPVPVIDFAKVEVLNPPWQTPDYSPSNAELVATIEAVAPPADLTPATNYTDRVAGALSTNIAAAAQSATNYTDAARASLSTSLAVAAQSATNYTDSAIRTIAFPVTSVNSKTGAVVLDANDIDYAIPGGSMSVQLALESLETTKLGKTGNQTLNGTLTVNGNIRTPIVRLAYNTPDSPASTDWLIARDAGGDLNISVPTNGGDYKYFWLDGSKDDSAIALLSDILVKSVKLNGTALTPDANGAVNVQAIAPDAYGSVQFPTKNGHYLLFDGAYLRFDGGPDGDAYSFDPYSTTSFTVVRRQDLAPLAPLASPAFTGMPTAPTPEAGNNSTNIATTAFVQTAISSISVTPLAGQTFDFATMQGIFEAVKACTEALGGSVTNFPSAN